MKKRTTHLEFIEKINKVYPDREWEVLGKYEFNTTPILVKDKYGECLIKPNSLLQRSPPNIKTAVDKTAYTINRFKEVWGEDMFDYSEFIYEGVRAKSTLICKAKGHRFLSDANNHLAKRGCPQCAKEGISERVRSNTEEFIEKAVNKYGTTKYSFTKTNYVTAIEDVIITCKKHGDFIQTPNRFLNGAICPTCSYKENTENFHTLKKKTNKSLLYIIECFNEDEKFLKIGVTTRTVKSRFRDDFDMPYNYNILREFSYANTDAPYALETELLRFTKSVRYSPKLKFSGRTETRCFSIKKPLLDLFDTCISELYYIAFVNFTKAYGGVFDKSILFSGNYSKVEVDSVLKGFQIHSLLNFS